jgi:hypothetical protein
LKTKSLGKRLVGCLAPPTARAFMVAAIALTLSLLGMESHADDVGAAGGAGGGVFRTTCEQGGQVVGFDVGYTNVLIAIAPICGDRRKSPTDTYGRPVVGGQLQSGESGRNLMCDTDAVVTILHVFWDKTPLVTRIGLTCWNTRNNALTNVLPDPGGQPVGNKRLICPQGEIATGIYGQAGTAIDQLGLICDNW